MVALFQLVYKDIVLERRTTMSKKDNSKEGTSEKKVRINESKFDAGKLRSLIEEKKTAEEIMVALNIKHRQTLKAALLKLISLDRKFYDISGMYVRNLKRPMINFKGEIKLTKNMLDFPGSTYDHGDQFEIEPSNEMLVLRRVTDG